MRAANAGGPSDSSTAVKPAAQPSLEYGRKYSEVAGSGRKWSESVESIGETVMSMETGQTLKTIVRRCRPSTATATVVVALAIGLATALRPIECRAQDASTVLTSGGLSGRVLVSGTRPEIVDEVIPTDQAVCAAGALGMADDHITIGIGGGLADVFVVLTPVDGGREADTRQVDSDHGAPSTAPQVITFANCRIHPHASIVRAGQSLALVNSDPAGHRIQIQSWNNQLNIQLSPSSKTQLRMEAGDPVPGEIRCGIHRWMDGVIWVTESPWAAITDSEGRFSIENLPPGQWRVRFWHSRIGYLSDVHPSRWSESTDSKGELVLAIRPGQHLDLGKLEIDGDRFRKPR